jgi:dGTPase
MPWPEGSRAERFHPGSVADQRNEFQRDRDRILYSSAFQRLAGITQIVKAGEESIFHTRQQHTIKVAQVGRRLAEAQLARRPDLVNEIDGEVVEAACLIHDLGHPPFGHVGETELNTLVTGKTDGFEGNAQSFRIITKLAVRKEHQPGINLTRATLAATLKYPWLRGVPGSKAYQKWSAYHSEEEEFKFATEHQPANTLTLEAQLMDWADDIAYSVHDLEDFHRCNVIPWRDIFSAQGKAKLLPAIKNPDGVDLEACFEALNAAIMDMFGETLREKYEGTRDQRWVLRNMTSNLINLYVSSAEIPAGDDVSRLVVNPDARGQVAILKQITRDHVIATPPLAAQQVGYSRIIKGLFEAFHDHEPGEGDIMPPFTPARLRYLWALRGDTRARFAADCVASLSEAEAIGMYARLNGINSGSVLDPIVR